jgi:hypothetical protein
VNLHGNKDQYVVKRRYTHFEYLRKNMLSEFEDCAVPVLPDKSVLEKLFYNNESQFVKERIRKLQHFLSIIVSHPILRKCSALKTFLTEKDNVSSSFNL